MKNTIVDDPAEIQKRLDQLITLDLADRVLTAVKVRGIYADMPNPYDWTEYHERVNTITACVLLPLIGFLPLAHIAGRFPEFNIWNYLFAGGISGACIGFAVGLGVAITPFANALEVVVEAAWRRLTESCELHAFWMIRKGRL